jgi:mycoredoxin
MAEVEVYGADWCPLTRRARLHLDRLGVSYRYINIDRDRVAARWVAEQNGGKEKKPTIKIGDRVLSEPSDEELEEALES